MKYDSPRQIALNVLDKVATEDAYANLLLPKLLERVSLSKRDSGFTQELSFGTIRWQLTYDQIIDSVSSRPSATIDSQLINCLRLGTHQLLQMRVPAHAAISETVELIRRNCGEKVVGFGNGVLRQISKKSFEAWINELTKNKSELQALSIKYSHPEWIVLALKQSLKVDNIENQLEALLSFNNVAPEVTYVALPGFVTREELESAKPDEFSQYGFTLESSNPTEIVKRFGNKVRVQDEGSQLAALALSTFADIKPDERWLDMCAGPGGKAALLAAEAIKNGVVFEANEIQSHRAKLVRDSISPLSKTISVTEFDGRQIGERSPNTFDRILIDAPCTGLGALRRRPEARWRKDSSDLKELTALQFELLSSGAIALKPGGLLLYVTCSPHLSETTAIVEKGIKQLGLQVLDLTAHLNAAFMKGTLPGGRKTVQLHGQRDGTDSMFMALLTKPL